MYVYLKDGAITLTSDELLQPRIIEDGEIIEDGLVYDDVIETTLTGRVVYEGGNIVAWENSEQKKTEDAKIIAEEKESMKKQLGELIIQKNGMIELGENTTEIETKIQELKEQYANL